MDCVEYLDADGSSVTISTNPIKKIQFSQNINFVLKLYKILGKFWRNENFNGNFRGKKIFMKQEYLGIHLGEFLKN